MESKRHDTISSLFKGNKRNTQLIITRGFLREHNALPGVVVFFLLGFSILTISPLLTASQPLSFSIADSSSRIVICRELFRIKKIIA